MSAYREQKTSINDAQCLMTALQAKGFKPVRHTAAVQLEGYHGDRRQQTAEIVIPRAQVGSASNDIGFKLQANGNYTAIISAFDSTKYNEAWLKDVRVRALEAKAKKIAGRDLDLTGQNFEFTRDVLPGGKIRHQYVKQGA
jgi:hypothetical protein